MLEFLLNDPPYLGSGEEDQSAFRVRDEFLEARSSVFIHVARGVILSAFAMESSILSLWMPSLRFTGFSRRMWVPMGPVRRLASKGAMFICLFVWLSIRAALAASSFGAFSSFLHIDRDGFFNDEVMRERKAGIGDGLEKFLCDSRFDESNCGCRCYHQHGL